MSNSPQHAVIYCRVSTKKQSSESHGLDSQEQRCREHADTKGYSVEAVFPDDVSGAGDFMKRPGVVALLSYLDAQSDKSYVVIFDDLKRFARDTEFHIKLRREFALRGARVECLNFKLEDTPEGEFIETILAAQGQLERKQNRRQVSQKMKARMMDGYWVFQAPVGYHYMKQNPHGKIMVRNEPLSSIVQEALESYASGRFESHAEVKRFFESKPEFPKTRHGVVTFQKVSDVMNQTLYAGLINHSNWEVHGITGKHEALVSLETYYTIQKRQNGQKKAPVRKDIKEDFPLRGFVTCGSCDRPMTSCWSKGRNRKYPYYLCDTKGCPDSRKSIRKEVIESEFEELLKQLQPSANLFALAFDAFTDFWNEKLETVDQDKAAIKRQITEFESKSKQLIDRLVEADSPTLIKAYEGRLQDIDQQKAIWNEKLANFGKPSGSFKQIYRTAFEFLANPWNLWVSERLEDKRAVLKLVFAERLPYDRNKGYRTAKTSKVFKALEVFRMEKSEMVSRQGFEPWTS